MQSISVQDQWLFGGLRSLAVLFFFVTYSASRLHADEGSQDEYDYPFPTSTKIEYFDVGTQAEYSPPNSPPGFIGSGNVHVNFDTPTGYVAGFRDYLNFLNGATIGAQAGPIAYVGNYGGTVDAGLSNSSITFLRLTDDINENGVPGAIIIVDPATGLLTTMTDFDDLHTFNIAFNQLAVQTQRNLRSFDVGAVFWLYEEVPESDDADARAALATVKNLDHLNRSLESGFGPLNNPKAVVAPPQLPVGPQFTRFAASRRTGGLGFVYGLRRVALWDRFRFDGTGGILGDTSSSTNTENLTTGPQIGLVGFKQFGPLSFYAHGLLVASWNDGNIQQDNSIGTELVPGATNRLLYAQPTNTNYQVPMSGLAPAGVFWAEAGLQLTKHSALKLAWSALFLDNIFLSDNRTRYFLPDMGLADPGNQNLFEQYVVCGIEVVR
jgi:hypothetical protein